MVNEKTKRKVEPTLIAFYAALLFVSCSILFEANATDIVYLIVLIFYYIRYRSIKRS